MSKLTSLDDLFIHELQKAYGAEGQILTALPKMMKAANNPDLKNAFEEHRQQTENHMQRLELVFMLLGLSIRAKTSGSLAALLDESGKMMREDAEPEVLDAALISAAQKVEHYEIASYGCLCTYAEMLGYDQAHRLLGQTLDEEETCDMRLTELAEAVINPQAVEGDSA